MRQFELAHLADLGAGLLVAGGLDGVGLLPVAVHGLAAVVGLRGHGATGGAVDQQAGRAEAVQPFHGRDRDHLVDIDGVVDGRGMPSAARCRGRRQRGATGGRGA